MDFKSKGNLLKKKVSDAVRSGLVEKYKKFPSCEKIARDIYNASGGELSPHTESVRKWLNGSVMPDPTNLVFLIEWLNLDLNNIYLKTDNYNESGASNLYNANLNNSNYLSYVEFQKLDMALELLVSINKALKLYDK